MTRSYSEHFETDKRCERCFQFRAITVYCLGQKWGGKDTMLTCAEPNCGWSMVTDVDWRRVK